MLTLLLLLTLAVTTPAQEPDLGTEQQREAGQVVYESMCSQCHGETGDGAGISGPYFRPAPRDFTTATFKIRTTESGELPTTDDLRAIIRRGMPYTGMPAWPQFTEEELTNLVYYLKTFVEDFADPDFVVAPLDFTKPPAFADESAQMGRKVYEDNKCIDCHGSLGRGDGEAAPTLQDDWGIAIRAADLTKRWTFRGGSSREDIYRTFTTGLNGTPMPSYLDLIEEDDRWHLVDFVYSLSADEPDYATVVTAIAIEGGMEEIGAELFSTAPRARFPVIGQVIQPGRNFYPGVNAVEVAAVYDQDEIAILVTWHDVTAETTGSSGPGLDAGTLDPETIEEPAQYSDAVAVQIPAGTLHGFAKPYFLFGDKYNAVDIWVADLANGRATVFEGRGRESVRETDKSVELVSAEYDRGEWRVIFKREREPDDGAAFVEGTFVPVAFSVWDGFNNERGNKRGVTSWYHVYVAPAKNPSRLWPAAKYFVFALLLELIVVHWVRRRHGRS